MRKISFILLFMLTIQSAIAQTGINTQIPSDATVLHINSTEKGILLPRVQLQAANMYQPLTAAPPNGTIVFNINVAGTGNNKLFQGYYQWQANKWIRPLENDLKPVVQYNPPALSITNFNPLSGGVDVDIFGNQKFAFDGAATTYTRVDNNQLKINDAGLYQVTLGLALVQVPPIQNTPTEFYLIPTLDNVELERVLSRVPQWRTNAANIGGKFDMSFTFYVNASAGQVLGLRSVKFNTNVAAVSIVNFDAASGSSITILKLK